MRGPVTSVKYQSVLSRNTSLRPFALHQRLMGAQWSADLSWFSQLLGPGCPTAGGELVFSSGAMAAKYGCLLGLSRGVYYYADSWELLYIE